MRSKPSCSCWKCLVFLGEEESQVGPDPGWRERARGGEGEEGQGGRERGHVGAITKMRWSDTHAVADTDPCEPGECANQRKQKPRQGSRENRVVESATERPACKGLQGRWEPGCELMPMSPQALAGRWLLRDE